MRIVSNQRAKGGQKAGKRQAKGGQKAGKEETPPKKVPFSLIYTIYAPFFETTILIYFAKPIPLTGKPVALSISLFFNHYSSDPGNQIPTIASPFPNINPESDPVFSGKAKGAHILFFMR